MRRYLWITCALVAVGCNRSPSFENGERPPYIQFQILAPEGFPVDKVASATIVLSPSTEEDLPFARDWTTFVTLQGRVISVRTRDIDGNGRYDLEIVFSTNPFQGRRAEFFLYPRFDTDGGASSQETPPVFARVRLFTTDGNLLASGDASTDVNGDAIRFGGRDRTVQLQVVCAPGAPCTGPDVVSGVRVTVARSRDCPTAAFEGTLNVLLLPAASGFVQRPVSRSRESVSYADEGHSETIQITGVMPGLYYGFAYLKTPDSLATTPEPGDLKSDMREIDILQDITGSVQLVLNQVDGVGPCTGGLPQAPPPPDLVGSIPASPSSNNQPLIVGTAVPGSTVRVYAGRGCQVLAGAAVTDAQGSFQVRVTVPDNTTTTFYATATSVSEYTSACSQTVVTYVEDSDPPAAPTVQATTPASPSNVERPRARGLAEAGSTVALFTTAGCTGAPAATGSAADFAAAGIELLVPENAVTTIRARATDAAGNVSPCSAGLAYEEDSIPPVPPSLVSTNPASPSTQSQLAVSGTAEALATVRLFVSSGCTGFPVAIGSAGANGQFTVPVSVSENSRTTFRAMAVDVAGNSSGCSTSTLEYLADSAGPIRPVIVSAVPSSRSIALAWAPALDLGAGVSTYDVAYCSPSPCAPPPTPQHPGLTGTSFSIPALSNCTVYDVFVRARDVLGNIGDYGTAATANVMPPVPQNVSFVPGPGTLEAAWDGQPFTPDYEVCYAASGAPCDGTAVSTGGKRALRLTNLPPADLRVAVRAVDGACKGPASPERSVALGTLSPLFSNGQPESDGQDGVAFGFVVFSPGDLGLDGAAEVFATSLETNGRGAGVLMFDGQSNAIVGGVGGSDTGFGRTAAPAGDVDGDGKPDFMVGAPGNTGATGVVHVYSAPSRLLFSKTGAAAKQLGRSLAPLGDVNGDGRGDVIIGAVDSVYVYSGPSGGLLRTVNGAAGEGFGTSVAGIGDVDGDGRGDYAVGAPNASSNAGAVYVYSGAAGGLLYTISGAQGEGLGAVLAALGDVDGDGKPDFAVGLPTAAPGGVTNAGSVHVYSGAAGALLRALHGTEESGRFGFAVAAAGDVDQDGLADFVVGAPGRSGNAGGVFVYSGRDGTLLDARQGSGTELLGFSVAAADVTGDGNPDIIAGSPFGVAPVGVGLVSVFATSNLLGLRPAETANAMGRPGMRRERIPVVAAGKTQLFTPSGGSGRYTFELLTNLSGGSINQQGVYRAGTTAGVRDTIRVRDDAGHSFDTRVEVTGIVLRTQKDLPATGATYTNAPRIAGVGDVNGDGVPDFVVGTPELKISGCGSNGRIYVYSGADGNLIRSTNGAQGEELGHIVGPAGDVNADGRADILAAAPRAGSTFGTGCSITVGVGNTYVYSGINGALVRTHAGPASYSLDSASLGSLGDVTGDGRSEYFIGIPYASPGGRTSAGQVTLHNGATGAVVYTLAGAANYDNVGSAVVTGDFARQDGSPDLAVGAPGNGGGKVIIYLGSGGFEEQRFNGVLSNEGFGTTLAALGDLNGDGFADLAVGTWYAGAITVISVAGDILYRLRNAEVDYFGGILRGLGDVDGDGGGDFIVGGANNKVLVYSGRTGQILHEIEGPGLDMGFGDQVSGIGDVNGDGRADVLVSARGPGAGGSVFLYATAVPPPSLERPAGLRATATSAATVALSWQDGAGETGYTIELRVAGRPWAQLDTVPADTVAYTATGLTPATTYAFRVKATSATGDSRWSGEAQASTP